MTTESSGPATPREIAATALAGRREALLLEEPSVARLAELLAQRCREPVWIRTAVVTLERFRELVASEESLGGLLDFARRDAQVAEEALGEFARRLPPCTDTQLSALMFGPKLWLRANGVDLPWRPPAEAPVAVTRVSAIGRGTAVDAVRLLTLALINSGLSPQEAVSLRIGDVGSFDADGALLRDRHADPLAVSYLPEGETDESARRLTFFTFEAREALVQSWAQRVLAGEELTDQAPLIANPDGSVDPDLVEKTRVRHETLIEAGNDVNVFMCRMTGDFFREWGMPGARFFTRQGEEQSS